MKIEEAIKIYEVWQLWFWPFHSLLFSIFHSNIPESFLPYPKNILYEALDEILKLHNENSKEYEAINFTKSSLLCMYSNDKEAFENCFKKLSIPGMVEITSKNIKKFTTDWVNWIKK
jgi:hypothetical protein